MVRSLISVVALTALSFGIAACAESTPTAVDVDTADAVIVSRVEGDDTGTSRPRKFAIITRVVEAAAGPGTARPIAGAEVTLTLLPLARGETAPAGASLYTRADRIATVSTDSSGLVRFYNIDVTRYRIDVKSPNGSAWTSTSIESGPSKLLIVEQNVPLRRR